MGAASSTANVATYIVAASDSRNKDLADFVADGTNDEVEIQAAIDALPATGGVVYLLEGTFYDDEAEYRAGDFIVRAPGAVHTGGSRDGALVLLVYF